MGVRNREEISQALNLNVTNHQRKQMVMSKIQENKSKNPDDKNLKKQNDPLAKKNKPEEDQEVCDPASLIRISECPQNFADRRS